MTKEDDMGQAQMDSDSAKGGIIGDERNNSVVRRQTEEDWIRV